MAELQRRPAIVTPHTAEAEVLGLIVEGVCSRSFDFVGFCSLEKSELKTTLANLKRKGFIRYLKAYRSWRPTDAGTGAYDDMREAHFKPEPKDLVGEMFAAMVAVKMSHREVYVRDSVASCIQTLQRAINVGEPS